MLPAGFTSVNIAFLVSGAFLVGMRRGGLNGGALLGIVLLVSHFEAPLSVGLGVIISLFADVQATVLLFKDVDWKTLASLLLPTLVGLAAGAVLGVLFQPEAFEWLIFAVIFLAYLSMLFRRAKLSRADASPMPGIVTLIAGFLSGFTSMIGNLASVFVAIFFAAKGASKTNFIATSVWYFFVLNIVKLPIHIFLWGSLTGEMILRVLFLLPVVALGIWVGRRIVDRLSEAVYWRLVVLVAGLATLRYFIVLLK